MQKVPAQVTSAQLGLTGLLPKLKINVHVESWFFQ